MKRLIINIILSIVLIFSTCELFAQKSNIDSLFVEFNQQKIDSVKIDLLVELIQEISKYSNDTLFSFYEKYETLINSKGNFTQKIKSNSIIGFYGQNIGNFKLALKKFNKNLEYSKLENDSVMIASSFGNIGNTYLFMGENKKAIEYYNKALEIFENKNNIRGLANLYGVLGNTYLKMGKSKLAIKNYEKSKKYFEQLKLEFGIATSDMNIGICYKNLKEFRKSLSYYDKAERVFAKLAYKKSLAEIYGNIGKVYFLIKDYDKALKYYKKDFEISKSLNLKRHIIIGQNWISECYIAMGDNEKAILFSLATLDSINAYNYEDSKQKAYENLYNAYQNKNNYRLALKYFKLYKGKTDSMALSEKNENIEKLLTEFESKEKEKEIQILNVSSEKQKNEIKAKQQERNLWIGISFLAIIIGGISIYFFFSKKKLSEQLSKKNKIISQTLGEKDVLHREIHHRVKNNLQIISSLLNMQSRYLSDDKSKEIVNESKNRIKSMSLIHQKLYQEENLTGIETETYFKELIDSLMLSYGINDDKVNVKISIENLLLDVDTAIPLGLILNEIISNAFKYGVDKETGMFEFVFKQTSDKELLLKVKDNGKGIPEDFDILKSKSYGMKLIQSLSKKLKADLEYKNNEGLEISMKIHKFKASKTTQNLHSHEQSKNENFNS